MTEIFKNVSEEAKDYARSAWRLAMLQNNVVSAAKFLNSATEYAKYTLTEEEVEFLQFYFHMQMEMMKE